MIYEILLVFILGCVVGALVGFMAGRHEAALVTKVRSLEHRKSFPDPQPAVIAGAYQPPRPFSTVPDKRPAGLVEAKTPEQLAWDEKQEFEQRVQVG